MERESLAKAVVVGVQVVDGVAHVRREVQLSPVEPDYSHI
jgi:hypothetical protein